MTTALLAHVELYALLPAAALIVAIVAARWRTPGPQARSALQHFAAGVVFSTVAVELLPDLTRSHAVVEVVVGFAAGVGLLLLIRRLAEAPPPSAAAAAESGGHRLPIGMLVAVGIDIFLDGLLVGLSFSVGAKEGLMVTAALTLELVSLGLAVGSSIAGQPRRSVAISSAALAGGLLGGAALGASVVPRLSDHALAAVLAFGCAALMFLVTEELLVEAHEAGETAFATALFFVGFVAFLVVGMLA
jgi:ZIP family zinc transporter